MYVSSDSLGSRGGGQREMKREGGPCKNDQEGQGERSPVGSMFRGC